MWFPFLNINRIILVLRPSARVIDDVFPNFLQFIFIANDVFKIIPLPEGCPRRGADFVDVFRQFHLETAYDFWN